MLSFILKYLEKLPKHLYKLLTTTYIWRWFDLSRPLYFALPILIKI